MQEYVSGRIHEFSVVLADELGTHVARETVEAAFQRAGSRLAALNPAVAEESVFLRFEHTCRYMAGGMRREGRVLRGGCACSGAWRYIHAGAWRSSTDSFLWRFFLQVARLQQQGVRTVHQQPEQGV